MNKECSFKQPAFMMLSLTESAVVMNMNSDLNGAARIPALPLASCVTLESHLPLLPHS